MEATRAVGVDAAGKLGWVALVIDQHGFVGAVSGSLADLIQWAEPVTAVGVDIPLGNFPWGGRAADAAARTFVGPRAPSVFDALPAAVVEADSYDAANRQLAENGRPKMSRQAWALRARTLEAEQLMREDNRIIETHPEVSFRALHGAPIDASKKTWAGQMLRRRLLHDVGIDIPDELDPGAGRAASDDVLDAAACAWSARRYALGTAQALPETVELDPHGRRMAIWY